MRAYKNLAFFLLSSTALLGVTSVHAQEALLPFSFKEPPAKAALGDVKGGENGAPRNPKTSDPSGTIQKQADTSQPIDRRVSSASNAQSRSSINSDAIQNAGAQNTYDAVKNVPGVTQSDAKGGSVADNVQIRGIHLSSVTGFRLDGGMPVVNNLIMPIEDKERIETQKGASALAYGLTSPAGIINLVMKRATDLPILTFGVASNNYGQAIGTLDFGERFGFDKQFGFRAIFSGGQVANGVHNAEGIKGLGAFTFDWNPNNRFSMKIDFEQFGVDAIEQGTLLQTGLVNNRVPLPRVPNYYQLTSGPWAKYQGVGQNVFLAGVYKLDYGFEIVGEAGRSESRKLHRNLAQTGAYDVITGIGKETVSLINNQDYVNTYVKGEIKNHFRYAFISNDVTLGINRNERDFNGPANGTYSYTQNIYNPTINAGPPGVYQTPSYAPNNSNDIGYYVSEDIGFFNRVHVLGGVRQITYNGFSVSAKTGALNTAVYHATAPAVGIVINVVTGIELYASYVKALQDTGEAPQNSANAFQILPPAKADQKEVGIRMTNLYNATATFAAFELNQANAITDAVTNIYAINGTQTVRGLEGTLRYNLLPQLWDMTLIAGGQLSGSKQHSTDPTIDGKESENAPRVSGNLGLVYRPGLVKGLTLNGGALFTGSRELTNQEQGKIPAVIIYNIGANYATAYMGHRVTYNISCNNLLNKSYFASAVNGALGVGRPRTIFFGGRFEF